MKETAENLMKDVDRLRQKGHALAAETMRSFGSAEGMDEIEVFGGHISLRRLAAILRPEVKRFTPARANDDGRESHDLSRLLTPGPRGLCERLMGELPESQFVAVLCLIDGHAARTYAHAARLMRVSLGTFQRHMERVRRLHPELYGEIMAYRARQLAERHEGAVFRERSRKKWRKARAEGPRLDIRALASSGHLSVGNAFQVRWPGATVTIAVRGNRSGPTLIELRYTYGGPGGWAVPMTTAVHLEYTACNFGGARAWFRCPGKYGKSCGGRVAILHYAAGHFMCGRCAGA